MRVLPGPTKSNTTLAWSADGRFLVAGGSGDGLTAWEVDTGAPGRHILGRAHGGRLMQFCPRSGRLYVAFQSGGFWHWDPATDAEHQHQWRAGDYYAQFYGLAAPGDGGLVLHWYRQRVRTERHRRAVTGLTPDASGALAEAWSRADEGWVDTFTSRPGTGELFGLGRHVEGELRFEWAPAESGELAGSFLVPPAGGRVTRWVLAPDGERVAWLTDRALFIRRLDDPATLLQLPAADGEVRRGLSFHPGGRMLAYTTGNTVRLIDADTFSEIRALDWNTGRARAVAFSPDGLRCAVSGEGGRGWVTVFDVE